MEKSLVVLGRLQASSPPRPMCEFDRCQRAELQLAYSTALHPLQQRLGGLVRMGWAEAAEGCDDLAGLHERLAQLIADGGGGAVPGCPAVLKAVRAAGIPTPQGWKLGPKTQQRHIKRFRASAEYAGFLAAYRAFVAEVVVPLVADPLGVIFQCPPTLRCVPRDPKSTCQPGCLV